MCLQLKIVSFLLVGLLLGLPASLAISGEVKHSDRCNEKQFPLHYAIWRKEDSKASDLIKRRKKINEPCYVNDLHFGDTTPLMVAVQRGNVDMIRLLIRNGVDVLGDPYNRRALHITASSYDLEDRADIVQVLLEAGADVNIDDFGTPLHLAAGRGYMEIVRLLISKGASPNARSNGTTPLYVAAQADQLEMAKFLIESGTTITSEDFLNAAGNGNLLVLHFFLKGGGDINTRDKYGSTALHRSANKLYGVFRECAELLLQKGANVNAKNRGNMTPLHVALRSPEFHPYSGTWFVERLIALGADLNMSNDKGDTPLDLAQDARLESIVQILRAAGAKSRLEILAAPK